MTKNIKHLTSIMTICLPALLIGCLTAITTGCSSTDVIDQPNNTESKGQTITLNISCPDAATSTRADNDHVLRYSAILYTGKTLQEGTLFERQEAIVTAEESKTFTFEVPEDDYSYIVFADYIPATSQPNSNDLYDDKYYNTEDPREKIYMRSFIDFSTYGNGNTKVDEKCFNNENYDCFAYFNQGITKGAEEVNEEITLERIVCRVAFKSSTDMPENTSIKNITFTKFDFFGTHTITDKSISIQHAGASSLNLSKFTLENPAYTETGELFFFYTFASPKTGQEVSLLQFEFTVNFDDESTYTNTVDAETIKPTPNHKITVIGPFLSAVPPVLGNLNLNINSLNTEQWGDVITKEI